MLYKAMINEIYMMYIRNKWYIIYYLVLIPTYLFLFKMLYYIWASLTCILIYPFGRVAGYRNDFTRMSHYQRQQLLLSIQLLSLQMSHSTPFFCNAFNFRLSFLVHSWEFVAKQRWFILLLYSVLLFVIVFCTSWWADVSKMWCCTCKGL